MTLQIQSDHVYTQLGVPVSVTGVAQVTLHLLRVSAVFYIQIFICFAVNI